MQSCATNTYCDPAADGSDNPCKATAPTQPTCTQPDYACVNFKSVAGALQGQHAVQGQSVTGTCCRPVPAFPPHLPQPQRNLAESSARARPVHASPHPLACAPCSSYCASGIAFDCPTDSVCRGLAPCAIRECCAKQRAALRRAVPSPCSQPSGKLPPVFVSLPAAASRWLLALCPPNSGRLPTPTPLAAAEPDETCSESDFACLDHRCALQRTQPA